MIRWLAALVLVGSLISVDARAQEAEGAVPTLAQVSWLSGCWVSSSLGVSIEEYWMPPRGGTMLGVSRTVRGDETTGYESVMIREVDGRLLYEAHPSGQASAVFEATRSSGEAVTFENPQHDFPRRIVYSRVGADSIRAEVDDGAGGGTIQFVYGRTDCGR